MCQKAVKDARSAYFVDLSTKNSHNPRVLFKVIDSVVSLSSMQDIEASPQKCEEFLDYFTNKVGDIRQQVSPAVRDLTVTPENSAALTQFQPVTLLVLEDTIFPHEFVLSF